MNATLHRSTTHPPDPQDRQVLHLPARERLHELALADRLSLRVGIWLLERAQRPHRPRRSFALAPPASPFLGDRYLTPRESITMLTFDLQRQLR